MSGPQLFADYRQPNGRSLARYSIVYGPLYSRRRGFSLGINLFPILNTCSFDCVYCYTGGANIKTSAPREGAYPVDSGLLRRALEEAFKAIGSDVYRLEAVDFAGNGEPTLHPYFSMLVAEARRVLREYGLKASLGVLTNSTRLCSPGVREALTLLDHVEAKLDSVVEWKFLAINRPDPLVRLSDILECLRLVRGYTPASIAVQTFLLEDAWFNNYEIMDAEKLGAELARIMPDIVNLYTAYAPPKVKSVKRVPAAVMESFAAVLRAYGLKVRVFPE